MNILESNRTVKIKKKVICLLAYAYIIVPIVLFMVTWLKLYIGLPMAAILLLGFYVIYKKGYKNEADVYIFPAKQLFIALAFLLFWVILSGAGKLFYETSDWNIRNAIFRDLINYSWPVIYEESGTALVYYIAQWLVPAIFGKIGGWIVGNLALMLWNYVGVVLIYLLLVQVCKIKKASSFYAVLIIFMCFGGLNEVGKIITSITENYNWGLLGDGDGWLDMINGYQYSSNYTLISWVFNQTIVPWLATLLILSERKVCNFAYIGLLVLPYAPIPFTGLFIVLVAMGFEWALQLLKQKNYIEIIKNVFSIPNLCAIFSVYICTSSYFSTSVNGTKNGWYIQPENFGINELLWLLVFWLIEVGVYTLPLWKVYKKDYLFHVVWIMLLFIPLYRVGTGRDFCMRASIVPLFILQIYLIKYLVSEDALKEKLIHITIFLIVMLSLGGFNTFTDVAGKIYTMKVSGRFPYDQDNVYTLSDRSVETSGNFLTDNLQDSVFYKYMARWHGIEKK